MSVLVFVLLTEHLRVINVNKCRKLLRLTMTIPVWGLYRAAPPVVSVKCFDHIYCPSALTRSHLNLMSSLHLSSFSSSSSFSFPTNAACGILTLFHNPRLEGVDMLFKSYKMDDQQLENRTYLAPSSRLMTTVFYGKT